MDGTAADNRLARRKLIEKGTTTLPVSLLSVDAFDSSEAGIDLSPNALLPAGECYSMLLVVAMRIDHYFSWLTDQLTHPFERFVVEIVPVTRSDCVGAGVRTEGTGGDSFSSACL